MDFGDAGAAPAALDALKIGFEQLLKVVEDRGLEPLDPAGTVGFWQEFERLRNRFALVDHQMVRDAQQKDLARELCQTSLPRAFGGDAADLDPGGEPAGPSGGRGRGANLDAGGAVGAGAAAPRGGAARR